MKTRSKIMMYVIETWYRIDIVDTNIFALHWLFDGNILLSIHIACSVENQNDIKSERLFNYVASTNSSISISFSLFSLFVRIACHSIELHSICNIRIEKKWPLLHGFFVWKSFYEQFSLAKSLCFFPSLLSCEWIT